MCAAETTARVRPPVDLEGVRLLIRIVSAGSIQGAAEQAGIPRSSLRRKLENLEATVGCELFVRGTSGVSLTPAGAVVLAEGRALLESYERMVRTAKSAKGAPAGILRVITPVGVPLARRIPLIRMTMELAPELRVEEIERPEPLEHLHDPFDLMFYMGDPPSRGSWYGRLVRRMRLVPLASEAYLERHGRPSSVEDLAHHRLISWRAVKGATRAWPLRSGGTVEVTPIHASHNAILVHRMAQEGLGIVLGDPDPKMRDAPGRLIPVLEHEVGAELAMRYLAPQPGEMDPRTRAILEPIFAALDRQGDAGEVPAGER